MKTIELRKRVHEIIDASDDAIVQAVYTLLQANHAENKLGESVEKYNRELEDAESEIDKGQFITQEDLKNEVKKW
jgi:mevalonate kinase